MERLDNFSKILLATGTINYISAQINAVNGVRKIMQTPNTSFDEILQEAVNDLAKICENLANFTNEVDIVAAIDERVTEHALDILLFGNDEVESDSLLEI